MCSSAFASEADSDIIDNMITTLKEYLAFFAAILNITASALYFDAIGKRQTDPSNVSDALATWFFAGSLLLWAIYLILFFTTKRSLTDKDR